MSLFRSASLISYQATTFHTFPLPPSPFPLPPLDCQATSRLDQHSYEYPYAKPPYPAQMPALRRPGPNFGGATSCRVHAYTLGPTSVVAVVVASLLMLHTYVHQGTWACATLPSCCVVLLPGRGVSVMGSGEGHCVLGRSHTSFFFFGT